MTDKKREEIEYEICAFYDKLDDTHTNTEYLQTKWAKMSTAQFESWLKKKYPLQLQTKTWEIEPTMSNFYAAAKVVGVSIIEKLALPYLHINADGIPVNTKPVLKMVLPIKKVQQVITKKNKVSIEIDDRNMKNGRLMTQDKGASTSDKEFEAMAIMGLYHNMFEFGTIKADAMRAKSEAYNTILITGQLSEDDFKVSKDDSLARNMISTYMLASHIDSNLVNVDGYTPYTLKERTRNVIRQQ